MNRQQFQENKEKILSLKELWQLDFPADKLDILFDFSGELLKWNQKINLLSRNVSLPDVVNKHIIDSFTLLPFLPVNSVLLDVGTGAGFPGLPLAFIRPDLRVILLEPRSKRVSFLSHIKRKFSLPNVEIIGKRIEEVDDIGSLGVDLVTSRAVAEPEQFLSMVKPLLAGGVQALLMLGPEKGKLWQGKSPLVDFKLYCGRDFKLPDNQGWRRVCRVGLV